MPLHPFEPIVADRLGLAAGGTPAARREALLDRLPPGPPSGRPTRRPRCRPRLVGGRGGQRQALGRVGPAPANLRTGRGAPVGQRRSPGGRRRRPAVGRPDEPGAPATWLGASVSSTSLFLLTLGRPGSDDPRWAELPSRGTIGLASAAGGGSRPARGGGAPRRAPRRRDRSTRRRAGPAGTRSTASSWSVTSSPRGASSSSRRPGAGTSPRGSTPRWCRKGFTICFLARIDRLPPGPGRS